MLGMSTRVCQCWATGDCQKCQHVFLCTGWSWCYNCHVIPLHASLTRLVQLYLQLYLRFCYSSTDSAQLPAEFVQGYIYSACIRMCSSIAFAVVFVPIVYADDVCRVLQLLHVRVCMCMRVCMCACACVSICVHSPSTLRCSSSTKGVH